VLEDYQKILREYVRGRFGIYALYRRDKLYYVGLASNLRNRLKSHLGDRHAAGWDSFSLYLTHTNEHLRELEALSLRISSPKGNRSRTRFAHAKDLRNVLRKQIEESQQDELAGLFEYAPPSRARTKRKRAKGDAGTRLRLTDVVEGRVPIRMAYKGKAYTAVIRKNGTIRFHGKTFKSPSAAAKSVLRRPVNGWYLWKYESAPANWVRLRELRG
jgi:hypothetical protein